MYSRLSLSYIHSFCELPKILLSYTKSVLESRHRPLSTIHLLFPVPNPSMSTSISQDFVCYTSARQGNGKNGEGATPCRSVLSRRVKDDVTLRLWLMVSTTSERTNLRVWGFFEGWEIWGRCSGPQRSGGCVLTLCSV